MLAISLDAVSEISPPHVMSEVQIGAKNTAREVWAEIRHLEKEKLICNENSHQPAILYNDL